MSWKFDAKHNATVQDSKGRPWIVRIRPDSFLVFGWCAQPLAWIGMTIDCGGRGWVERAGAMISAEADLSELGFIQPPEPTE